MSAARNRIGSVSISKCATRSSWAQCSSLSQSGTEAGKVEEIEIRSAAVAVRPTGSRFSCRQRKSSAGAPELTCQTLTIVSIGRPAGQLQPLIGRRPVHEEPRQESTMIKGSCLCGEVVFELVEPLSD